MRALVAARRCRTLLLIRYIVGTAADDAFTRQAFQVLRQVQLVAPQAVDRVLDHPSVGAWATRTAVRLRQNEPAAPAELARMAVAAAARGGGTATVLLPLFPPRDVISLPSLGTALLPPPEQPGEIVVRCGEEGIDLDGRVRIPAAWREPLPGWRPTPEIAVDSHGVRAAFLLGGWAPGELASDVRLLDNPDVALWQDRITEGWDLLVSHHQEVAEELAAAVTVLTPLHTPPSGVSSATLVDAFGCIFLSLAPDAASVAVTLAHEVAHTKLNALMDLFELLEPVAGERFYAPWRGDPRPLAGLLHGTYAFTGVTSFWRRQREHEASAAAELYAHAEFARWRVSALMAARTLLGSGRLTEIGHRFVSGMAEVLEQWSSEPVPKQALTSAARLMDEHRAKWLTAYLSSDHSTTS